jgi:hypothetical protein
MALKTAVLWIHALCGMAWIGACASFVIAASALAAEAEERDEFAAKSAPGLNRLCLVLACMIPLTGVVNLTFAARARHFALPEEFIVIVGAKVILFAAMATALWAACGIVVRPGSSAIATEGLPLGVGAVHSLLKLYGLIVTLGAVALALGLWLSGT